MDRMSSYEYLRKESASLRLILPGSLADWDYVRVIRAPRANYVWPKFGDWLLFLR